MLHPDRQLQSAQPDPNDVVSCASLAKLLSVPTRLELLIRVSTQPGSVQELATRTSLDASLLSHHLRSLREAGLVEAEGRGHERVYRHTASVEVVWSHAGWRLTVQGIGDACVVLESSSSAAEGCKSRTTALEAVHRGA